MYTLGYAFKPWERRQVDRRRSRRSSATSAQTAREHGIDQKIRFNHRVVRAEWSSDEQRWTVEAERTDTGETVAISCGFLFMCSGYYRYDEGYTPEFAGIERFAGPDRPSAVLDRRRSTTAASASIVIGSGATAVTLVPAMAERGRARDDAPALAQLRRLAARPRTRSPSASAACFPRAGPTR